jgi:monoterpene epsilon-lactone hydrolase
VGNSAAASVARLVVAGLLKPALAPGIPLGLQRRWVAVATAVLPPARGVRFEKVVLGGVSCERVVPRTPGLGTIIYLHGGGYVLGSPRTHRSITSRLARASGMTVVVPDYRLAPEHPHPAALEDARAVFDAVVVGATPPARVAMAGDSAGGGLALALCLSLRAAGVVRPACLALISPWADLTNTRLAAVRFDPLLDAGWLEFCAAAYAVHRARTDPMVSPLYDELSDLPPMLVHVAGQEQLLEDARRLAATCARAGVPCRLREFDPLWHDFQLYAGLVPEATESVEELAAFAREHAG